MNKPYENKRYFGIALDPIHIGTGGYRLGRVDNTIARDAATNLPIIFGSSIEGTARTYSAYKLAEDDNSLKAQQGKDKREYLNCAGKSEEEGEKKRVQCGECEICITYGFSKKEKSLHGMAQFSDAKILFFPVHTMIGPVWVTTGEILKELTNNNLKINNNEIKGPEDQETIVVSGKIYGSHNQKLNLGWLYLATKKGIDIKKLKVKIDNETEKELEELIDKDILERYVIVHESIFHQIVNSNLEVRTSVSIDPQTGAAEERALFTYEVIPRSTVMYFDVVYNNPKHFDGIPNDLKDIQKIKETVRNGLYLFEHLGIGGMGTRGFGRFQVLNLECDKDDKSE